MCLCRRLCRGAGQHHDGYAVLAQENQPQVTTRCDFADDGPVSRGGLRRGEPTERHGVNHCREPRNHSLRPSRSRLWLRRSRRPWTSRRLRVPLHRLPQQRAYRLSLRRPLPPRHRQGPPLDRRQVCRHSQGSCRRSQVRRPPPRRRLRFCLLRWCRRLRLPWQRMSTRCWCHRCTCGCSGRTRRYQ